jgi:hypothetical protein
VQDLIHPVLIGVNPLECLAEQHTGIVTVLTFPEAACTSVKGGLFSDLPGDRHGKSLVCRVHLTDSLSAGRR